jgi:sortase B
MDDKLLDILDETTELDAADSAVAIAADEGIFDAGEFTPEFATEPEAQSQKGKRGIIGAVVPQKGDSPLEVTRKAVFIVSLIVAVVCFTIVLRDINADRRADALHTGLFEEFMEPFRLTGIIPLAPEIVDDIRQEVPGIMDEYIALYNENNDLVGYINIPGTRIDYPVLQYRRYDLEANTVTGSNQYYLYRDFYGRDLPAGSIYAEWRIPFTPTSRPNNTVLYGHNMGNGSRFTAATRYYSYHASHGRGGSIQFYLDNPLIYFDTVYEKGVYKVFAAMYVHTQEERFDDVFDYFRWREFPDRDTFYAFIVNVLDRSSFYTDVDLQYGDEILTLSTCYYPLGEAVDSRVAVFARRVRPGESKDVNLEAAHINPSPLFFNYFYRVRGGSWDGRNWDTGKVRGLDAWLEARGEEPIPLIFRDKRDEVEAREADENY